MNEKNPCPKCDKLKSIKAKVCRGCYNKANIKIVRYCMDCGKKIDYRSKRCQFCENSRNKRNHNYKDGRSTEQHHCLDCGGKITWQAIRCKRCATVNRFKKNVYEAKSTKPEKQLNKLLQRLLPNEYKYVGNFKFWIDGFNPDFVNVNGQKKIIELFGDYWHNLPNYKIRDKNRLKSYNGFGYKTLIVWEHELQDLNSLKTKLLEFNECRKS